MTVRKRHKSYFYQLHSAKCFENRWQSAMLDKYFDTSIIQHNGSFPTPSSVPTARYHINIGDFTRSDLKRPTSQWHSNMSTHGVDDKRPRKRCWSLTFYIADRYIVDWQRFHSHRSPVCRRSTVLVCARSQLDIEDSSSTVPQNVSNFTQYIFALFP